MDNDLIRCGKTIEHHKFSKKNNWFGLLVVFVVIIIVLYISC